jgi:hypothetical protein
MAFAGAKAGGLRCRRALRAVSPTIVHPSGQVRPPGTPGLRQHGSSLRGRYLFPGLKARAFAVLVLRRSFCAGVRLLGVVLGFGVDGRFHSIRKPVCYYLYKLDINYCNISNNM